MREIKFRGKRIANNEWVYGFFTIIDDKPAIITDSIEWIDGSELRGTCWDFVDKNTAGQFTGLQDSTGKDVYEGDIVLQQGYNGRKKPMVVRFECGAFIVGYHNGSSTQCRPMLLNRRCKVVGNIHDNKLEDFK